MEGDVGAQVAPPTFHPIHFHETLARKRDFPWQNPTFHSPPAAAAAAAAANWNPNLWHWDSVGFSATPEGVVKPQTLIKKPEEDSQNLTLKLGVVAEEQPAAAVTMSAAAAVVAPRPSKRVRSGSPGRSGGGGGSYPMCQVDDCRADLTSAKDYHRRHKVCEVHSKTTMALVGKQMQRFCQQCSRFHPLSEFDEGKRSCRRRLAGHNRRRRKTQPEDVSSKLQVPGNQDIGINGSIGIVNLLAILAKLQGNNAAKQTTVPSLPDRDRLIQILGKINTLKDAAPKSRGFDLNVSQAPERGAFEQLCKANGNFPTAPSTIDLLTVVSAALAASAPDVLASLSQASSYSSEDKTKMPSVETATDANSHSKRHQGFSSGGDGRPPLQMFNHQNQVQDARQTLPLQLFGAAEDDSPPKVASSVKYFSSESSNPMEDRSPSSSPPVAQKLFPLHSSTEQKYGPMSVCREDTAVEASTSYGWSTPLDLFKESEKKVENGMVHSSPYQAGYTSSFSDHSPSSSNSDAQDRTGRIIFKLFDKDPSKIPATLRTQIVNWLSHSPSEMESYIRPGCVVLSLYLSMPPIAWDELDGELLHRVTSLVQCSDSEFWRNGRFLVRTCKQLASHKDGKIRLCKSWRTWSAPELMSVSPVAVVSGQETALVLRGRNLTIPGTKIHCTYKGGYTSKEVLGLAYPGTIYDDSSMESFNLPGGFSHVFGRCFIEVENGFKGNSFPLIIANSTICQELRDLETEFEEVGTREIVPEDQIQDNRRPSSREDLLHFLNELGWLFQRLNTPSCSIDFSCLRFKFLFTFSVERDWSALIRMLLDTLVARSLKSDALAQESLEMLLEIQLLNRAVKRKCRKMVGLLVNYSVIRGDTGNGASKMYIFPPNSFGPGGLTPLHLAASAQGSEDMVDELTNDPQEIGLNCWNSIHDDNGQTPYMYASQRNNHSYNQLVARKLADRKSHQVSIDVGNTEIKTDNSSWMEGGTAKAGTGRALKVKSCAQCALVEITHNKRVARSRGLLARPYVHSMLAIAAVCVCVCLFFRGSPQIGSVAPFKWENLDFGPK